MIVQLSDMILPSKLPQNRRVYRKATICEMLDVCPGTIDNMVEDKLFVQPIKIGARSIGFVAEEVDQWLKDRIAERDAKLINK